MSGCEYVLVADADFVERMGPELGRLLPMLDERARRLVLGAVARAAGEGGTAAVAAVTGASWQTVANGAAELESRDSAAPGRVRRPGAGRKPLASTDEGLAAALRELVEASTRGDPVSPLRWTTLSLRQISAELTGQGHRCGKNVAGRLLAGEGYSMQGNSRTIEGSRHPDRDAQFRYIAARAAGFLAAGDPVISVDTKKKEKIGRYGQPGRSWRPAGDPVAVLDHDFPAAGTITAIPYGIYDQGANAGYVNVGTDHDTAAFAVESILRWWQDHGAARYPQARRLLVTADSGGSNSIQARGWKAGLAALAARTGLRITVCHFPPGTSKWNKIEHRLFCHITRAWRARPLTSLQLVIDTIAAAGTAAGLTVTARLDLGSYPEGVTVSDQDWADLQDRVITRHQFHGTWNYDIEPVPRRPAPPAAPPGPPPRPWAAVLAHPALTGMTSDALAALTAALQVPAQAAREERLYRARGRPRSKNSGRAAALTLPETVTAAICHQRLGITSYLLAQLLGTSQSAATRAISAIGPLLAQQHVTITPAARITSLEELHQYAATAGITTPRPAHTPPPQHTKDPRHTANSP